MNSGNTIKNTTKGALGIIITFALVCPAYAAKPSSSKPAIDYFSAGSKTSTNKTVIEPPQQLPENGACPAMSDPNSAAVKWFEQFDDAITSHRATVAENVILGRPFNQEAERVKQWTDTAEHIIKRYRQLAKMLKAMPTPTGVVSVKEYRDLTADWFSDAADIYEELIKPRPPAKTIEELNAGLSAIKERAYGLSQTNANLRAMDMKIRKAYKVHLARSDDALQQYIRSK